MKKLFIPEEELEYIESNPHAFAAAYSEPDDSEDANDHEFIDINRLWHDVSEKPEHGKWVIGHLDKDCFDVAYINSYERWKRWCEIFGVIRWAYIEDLLPNQQKKEHRE